MSYFLSRLMPAANDPISFPQFSRLPQEIQDMIWECVRGYRLSLVIAKPPGDPPTRPIRYKIIPRESTIHPLLHTCHASREIFKKRPGIIYCRFGPRRFWIYPDELILPDELLVGEPGIYFLYDYPRRKNKTPEPNRGRDLRSIASEVATGCTVAAVGCGFSYLLASGLRFALSRRR